MKKKIISVLMCSVLAMSMFSFTGCNKSSASSKKGEITLMFWDDFDASEDLITKGYKESIDKFNEDYKGKYHCNTITTSSADYPTKLNAKIAAGETPDIFVCNPGPKLKEYVKQGVAADMTDILESEEKEWGDTFLDGMFDKITFDGKKWAIPTNYAAACMYYNTELFKKAGIEDVPKTFDELLEACKKLKKAKITPITVSVAENWCLSMVAAYLFEREGGQQTLEDVESGKQKWTNDSYKKAMEDLVELSEYFQDTAKGDSNDVATANFYDEKAAMLIQGSWAIAQMNGNCKDKSFQNRCGVMAFPTVKEGDDVNPQHRLIVKTDNMVMSSKTKNKDAVIALMKYFTNEEAQKYTVEVGGKMPVINCDVDENKAPAQYKYIKDIVKKAEKDGTLGFYNESLVSTEAGQKFDDAITSVVIKDSNIDDALNSVEKFYKKNELRKEK